MTVTMGCGGGWVYNETLNSLIDKCLIKNKTKELILNLWIRPNLVYIDYANYCVLLLTQWYNFLMRL